MHRKKVEEMEAAEEAEVKPVSHPTTNLQTAMSASLGLATGTKTPLNVIDVIYSQPKDIHGNILIGLDNRNFAMWDVMKYIFSHGNVFQPVIFPTNPNVINAILQQPKNGPHAEFSGNQSTDIIKQLVGDNNIFAAKDAKTHHVHKSAFVKYLSDAENNIKRVSPIIQRWIQTNSGKIITEKTISNLCAQIMLAFLLNEQAAANLGLVHDLLTVKNHFVDSGVNLSQKMFSLFGMFGNGVYETSKNAISREICDLYVADTYSYPRILKNSNFSMKQTESHIQSLLMVGFDNLLSCLMTMIHDMAKHPEHSAKLSKNIQIVDGVKYIDFNLHTSTDKTKRSFSQKFFIEALRLNAPVWLQARKAKINNITITYKEDGEEKSCIIPGKTLVMIPNFQLARGIKDGDDFVPERKRETPLFPFPFSIGRNDCPGRNIGYAAAGVLVAELLSTLRELQIISEASLEPKVSLLLKNMRIKLIPKEEIVLKEEPHRLLLFHTT